MELGEKTVISGYINGVTRTKDGEGNHLRCTLISEAKGHENIRFSVLEPLDSAVQAGTKVVNGTFQRAFVKGGEMAPAVDFQPDDRPGVTLKYYTGYITAADSVVNGARSVLGDMLAASAQPQAE
jgi:hypothetical protein